MHLHAVACMARRGQLVGGCPSSMWVLQEEPGQQRVAGTSACWSISLALCGALCVFLSFVSHQALTVAQAALAF